MADQRIIYSEEMVGASHPTKSDTLNRLALIDHNNDGTHEKLTLGSDADGDMYYRASSVLARLAKGAANLKLFMNAGATAPEWAVGIKIGSHTRDLAAGAETVAYTGYGFKPSAIFVFVSPPTGGAQYSSWGFSDGSVNIGLAYTADGNKFVPNSDFGGGCMAIQTGSGAYQYVGTVNMTADGFEFVYSKAGSPTGVVKISVLALR
jgi:hypothetical protein